VEQAHAAIGGSGCVYLRRFPSIYYKNINNMIATGNSFHIFLTFVKCACSNFKDFQAIDLHK